MQQEIPEHKVLLDSSEHKVLLDLCEEISSAAGHYLLFVKYSNIELINFVDWIVRNRDLKVSKMIVTESCEDARDSHFIISMFYGKWIESGDTDVNIFFRYNQVNQNVGELIELKSQIGYSGKVLGRYSWKDFRHIHVEQLMWTEARKLYREKKLSYDHVATWFCSTIDLINSCDCFVFAHNEIHAIRKLIDEIAIRMNVSRFTLSELEEKYGPIGDTRAYELYRYTDYEF